MNMNNFGHFSIVFEYDMMCARVYRVKCFNFSNIRTRTYFYIKIHIQRMRILINSVTSLLSLICHKWAIKNNAHCTNHSGPQFSAECEFWAEPWKFSIEFCGIRHWLVISEQIQHILIGFRWLYARFWEEIYDCHSGSNGRNIEWSLSDILPAYLVDRLYLTVVVAGNNFCTFG